MRKNRLEAGGMTVYRRRLTAEGKELERLDDERWAKAEAEAAAREKCPTAPSPAAAMKKRTHN